MLENLKRIVYRAGLLAVRLFWRLRGGRKVRAFGTRLNLRPDTTFPSYRTIRLPRGSSRAAIVRYGDFVQIHAAARHLEACGGAHVVVDVGAHHGAYAVLLGKIVQSKGGRVIAIEPNPASFAILWENVARNGLRGTVRCVRAAVSDTEGESELTFGGSESQLGTPGASRARVAVTTLAAVVREHGIGRVELHIVDVEGAELPVLRGVPWDDVPVGKVFCEFHPGEWRLFGYGPGEIRQFLRERRLRALDMYLKEWETLPDAGYLGPMALSPEAGRMP